MKKHIALLGTIIIVCAGVFACGDKKDEETKGDPIGAPKVTPPVERNVPAGVKASALQGESPLNTPEKRLANTISTYLKPKQSDAVGALDRLKSIDDRMASLDKRAQESESRLCLKDKAKSYTLAAALPGSNTMALSFQCQENLDNGKGAAKEAQIAFGITTESFYLFERTGGSNNAVLARATLDETTTEYWQLGAGNSESYIHLIAKDGQGLEFTSSGTGTNGLDCGIHMKSNATLIYAKGKDSSGGACTDTEAEICLKATDLSDATVAECTTAGLTTFSLSSLTMEQAEAADGHAAKIISTPITGYTDFTKGEFVETPKAE